MSQTKNDLKKGKKKFVPLKVSTEIDPILPGRLECDCEASRHELLANCLNCGRIICSQEGAGPCFTCNQHVYSRQEKEEIEVINKKIAEYQLKEKKVQQEKKNQVSNLKDIAASLQKAKEHKDRLLDFERNSAQRTKVIDDEMDYFDMSKDNWLGDKEREEIQKKAIELHENKFKQKSTYYYDVNSGKAVEEVKPVIEDFHKIVADLNEKAMFKSDYEIVDFRKIMEQEADIHPFYVEEENKLKKKENKKEKIILSMFNLNQVDPIRRLRIQDPDLLAFHDQGFCLTICQPFASFLLRGIKLHEGRKWFTPYRGRLWIHSSAKSPRQEEIQEAKSIFKFLSKSPIAFPSNYPLSLLLGCVQLVDCLSQEEYRKQYPDGYCEDDYVFICDQPILLKNPLPIQGKQKIFKLEEKIHKQALKQLEF